MMNNFERNQQLYALKSMCFSDSGLYNWTFENDNGKNPNISRAKCYVDRWDKMLSENIGLLLWGEVGTGKSYFAACIANALIEQCVSVKMTNFASILNDLFSCDDKNEYIGGLNESSLLIIDDLGIERNTEYALEQVYNIIDAQYKSNKPVIITTNLSFTELKHPVDTFMTECLRCVFRYDLTEKICAVLRQGTKWKQQNSYSIRRCEYAIYNFKICKTQRQSRPRDTSSPRARKG